MHRFRKVECLAIKVDLELENTGEEVMKCQVLFCRKQAVISAQQIDGTKMVPVCQEHGEAHVVVAKQILDLVKNFS